jgi:hypothetical protein
LVVDGVIVPGVGGKALVRLNVLATDDIKSQPFTEETLIGNEPIPVPTPAKLTVITFVVPPDN